MPAPSPFCGQRLSWFAVLRPAPAAGNGSAGGCRRQWPVAPRIRRPAGGNHYAEASSDFELYLAKEDATCRISDRSPGLWRFWSCSPPRLYRRSWLYPRRRRAVSSRLSSPTT